MTLNQILLPLFIIIIILVAILLKPIPTPEAMRCHQEPNIKYYSEGESYETEYKTMTCTIYYHPIL